VSGSSIRHNHFTCLSGSEQFCPTRMRPQVFQPVLFQKYYPVLSWVYPEVTALAAWSENCKWYSSLPLGAVVSLFS
jgi:hypothetical protein